MTQATIYHNPRCSKSRQALNLLKEKKVEIKEVHYLETPPTKKELDSLCSSMGIAPQQIIRTKESLFKELGLNINDQKTKDEWLEIMVKHPKLIERPIVKMGEKVIVGRPPELIENLF